jgi:hypothetical protein
VSAKKKSKKEQKANLLGDAERLLLLQLRHSCSQNLKIFGRHLNLLFSTSLNDIIKGFLLLTTCRFTLGPLLLHPQLSPQSADLGNVCRALPLPPR